MCIRDSFWPVTVAGRRTVDRLGKDSRHRGLAHPPGTGEEIGVSHSVLENPAAESPGDGFLANHLFEFPRPVPASDDFVFHPRPQLQARRKRRRDSLDAQVEKRILTDRGISCRRKTCILARGKRVRAHKEIPGGLLPLGSDPLSEHLIALINPGDHLGNPDRHSIDREKRPQAPNEDGYSVLTASMLEKHHLHPC